MPAADRAEHSPVCLLHAGSVSWAMPLPAPACRGGRCGSRRAVSNSPQRFMHDLGQFHPARLAHGGPQLVAHRPSAAWAVHSPTITTQNAACVDGQEQDPVGQPYRRQIRASAGRADTNTYAVVRPRRMAEPDSARSRGTAGRARVTAAMEGCLIFCPVIGLASLNGTLPEAASARIGSVRAARPNLMSSGESRAWSRRSRRPRRLGVGWFSYLTPAAAHNQFGKSARSTRHR